MFLIGAIVGTATLGLIVSLFGDRYESSPEEVQEACEELTNISNNTLQAISDEIGNNVTIVNNASYGYVDISNMNAYTPAVQESITNLVKVLDKQAAIIQEYNDGSVVEKILGTGTMTILNLAEGMVSVTENIVDAGANIVAGFGTMCGFDMEAVELWAAKDHIGGWFDNAYENGALSWVEKYSIYSHESTFAEVVKGFGTAIPYVALAATGVGLVAEASIAGAAGFGRGSTNYQQQHLVYDANGEASFDRTYSTGRMMWEGAKQGAIDAALTVGMDKGFKAIGNKLSAIKAGKAAASGADDAAKAVVSGVDDIAKAATNSADDVGKSLLNSADDAVKAVTSSADDAAKAVTSSADDAAKAVTSSADDAAKAGQNAQESLSKTKQELLDKMKSGEISRDEMLEGVRKAANPESALNADKARLLEDFKAGKITRDEMIKGVQQSAGNAPVKNLVSQLDNVVDGTIKSTDDIGKSLINVSDDIAKVATNSVDDVGKSLIKSADDAGKSLINVSDDIAKVAANSADDVGKSLLNSADEVGENAFSRYASKMSAGEKAKYANFLDDGLKATQETAEQAVKKTASEVVEQTGSKTAQSSSKWHSPLEATTPRAKLTKAYDTAVENMKNAATSAKSKFQDAVSGLKTSGSTASTGTRLGEKTIPSQVTKAYDNVVDGIKTAGTKAGTVAKKVATDTATFVKENPKSAILGGSVIAAEKTIGNLNTRYIPTDYASDEVKSYAKAWNGDTIGIDEVDDMIIDNTTVPTNTDTSSGGYTGGSSYTSGTYKAPDSSTISTNTDSTNTDSTNTSNNQTNNTDLVDDKVDDNKTDESKTDENINKNEDTNNNEGKDDITPTPNPDIDNNSNSNTNTNNNNNGSSNQGSSGTSHGGTSSNSSYNSSGTSSWNSNSTTGTDVEETTELEPEIPIEEEIEPSEEIEEESVYTIPSNLSGVTETKKKNSGTGVLPVLGGLGAAAAVGVGAKMYLDNKKNNDNGDDGDEEEYVDDDEEFNTSENDDLLADEWNGEDTELNPYDNSSERDYITPDDEDLGEM